MFQIKDLKTQGSATTIIFQLFFFIQNIQKLLRCNTMLNYIFFVYLAAITGSKFRIQSCPLLASSQHVGATAAVTNLFFLFVEQRTILGLAAC